MNRLCILFLVISSVCEKSFGQTTYAAIPDSNFVHYLKTIVPTAFKGDSLNKTSTLVTTTTHTINCPSMSIANLSGVQYFTSLTYLDCNLNQLTNLPSLPNSLKTLECGANFLTSLPPLPNTLQTLECSSNHISCFPTFPNSITSLAIDPNPYNCLPNYIPAMSAAELATPLCAAGNSNGCAVATGIQQFANSNEVSLYPNPASSSLQVTFSGNIQNTTLQITDMLGNTVKQSILYNLTSIIDISNLADGVYTISISSSVGVANKRLVIVR